MHVEEIAARNGQDPEKLGTIELTLGVHIRS